MYDKSFEPDFPEHSLSEAGIMKSECADFSGSKPERAISKKCSSCKIERAATSENFYKASRTKDGFQSACIICTKARGVRRRDERPESDFARARRIRDESGLKICAKCKTEKPASLDFFPPHNKNKSGLQSWCRECNNEYKRERYLNDPEFRKAEDERTRARWHADENYRLTQGEKNRANLKKLRSTPEWRARRAAYMRERRRTDARFALDSRMSVAIGAALRKVGSGKKGKSWIEHVEFTEDELIAHLTAKFLPGMSLDNRSEWHVDHIRPISSFNYTSAGHAEFKTCWSLSNLQPLWIIDNLKKNARLDWTPEEIGDYE